MNRGLRWKGAWVPSEGDVLVVWERPYCGRDLEMMRADGILVRVESVIDDAGGHVVVLAAWTAAIIVHDDAIVVPSWKPDHEWSGDRPLIALPLHFALGTRYLLNAFHKFLLESKASEATLLAAFEAIGRGAGISRVGGSSAMSGGVG